ncbi:MAG TPA: M48 family metallopeptidase [Methylomirabilota bacterium]|nr:M48 family metallopeptidase [Methylomirabilota bacterium]
MNPWWKRAIVALVAGALLSGCAVGTSQAPPPSGQARRAPGSTARVDPAQAERLKQVMVPLIRVMNDPVPLNEVRVGIMDDEHVNAANAGRGEFYVTTGLLRRASDDQLRGVLAHEIAHADLGHVAKLQTLGAGLNIGVFLLEQIIPGSSAITPLAGRLIANAYTRREEYAADAHGATLLQRGGEDGRTLMVDTLTWLEQAEGASGGGFFATHPATGDRIQALREAR